MKNKYISNLILVYQPKVNIIDETIDSFEALSRFKDEFDNELNTLEVINSITHVDDMRILTQTVISSVINDFKLIERLQKSIFNVSINITSVELEDIRFKPWIEEVFKNNEIYIKNIELEITERYKIRNSNKLIDSLKFLKQKGFKVSFDDLGSGFNNINLIKKYAVDSIKLDKKITELISKDKWYVKKIIDDAHNFNIKVVAEGVEDLNTFEELKKIKCDLVQGYYFYKPISLKNILNNKKEIFKYKYN